MIYINKVKVRLGEFEDKPVYLPENTEFKIECIDPMNVYLRPKKSPKFDSEKYSGWHCHRDGLYNFDVNVFKTFFVALETDF